MAKSFSITYRVHKECVVRSDFMLQYFNGMWCNAWKKATEQYGATTDTHFCLFAFQHFIGKGNEDWYQLTYTFVPVENV